MPYKKDLPNRGRGQQQPRGRGARDHSLGEKKKRINRVSRSVKEPMENYGAKAHACGRRWLTNVNWN